MDMDKLSKPIGQRLMQSMANNTETGLRRNWRLVRNAQCTLLILCVMTCWCAGTVFAEEAGRIRAYGSLTSVENDGTVLIKVNGNTNGYLVDHSIQVVNRLGESCSLDELTLPAGISFDYTITSKGPIVQRIKELNR